ncbi:hypothetical protein [Bifidobacterium callitrichidarum]|uniref:Uncharacterized protein n=1 Tax=Bifidobacterium callitrichidarum TaxID=2052941 RepID=A0A2U2NBU9_9BIFI|nr:hypothetical protein [Bifidobacterium callitrichidarum]PWG66625.1 hypothetical protein DF196_01615 [Bifidobacterium callitrichidarum]
MTFPSAKLYLYASDTQSDDSEDGSIVSANMTYEDSGDIKFAIRGAVEVIGNPALLTMINSVIEDKSREDFKKDGVMVPAHFELTTVQRENQMSLMELSFDYMGEDSAITSVAFCGLLSEAAVNGIFLFLMYLGTIVSGEKQPEEE